MLISIDTIQRCLQAGEAADVSISIIYHSVLIATGYTDGLLGGYEEQEANRMLSFHKLFPTPCRDIYQNAESGH
jgi:hypothetical protein